MTSRTRIGGWVSSLLWICLAGCGDVRASPDAGGAGTDSGGTSSDAGADASSPGDAGRSDSDSGPGDSDAGPGDGGSPDSGPPPGSPTCTISAPVDGTSQPYDDDFTFVASASDPEDGALSGASVVWTSSLDGVLGTGLSITTMLEPGDHTITCTATDSGGLTGIDSIGVTSQSPVAQINHPGDGETRSSAMPIAFVGIGRDLEDGPLTGASLVWTSNLDGMLGTGPTFTRTLSAGTNVVTLTATDSAGNTGTDSITLTITTP